ncbi:U3 small nucleolar RNA-associated protein [Savitreella phatthalungensis]
MAALPVAIHRSRFVDHVPSGITAIAFSHRSSSGDTQSNALRCAVGRANGDIEIWNPRDNWTCDLVLKGGIDRTIEGLAWANQKGFPPRLFSIGGATSITEWSLDGLKPRQTVECNAGPLWSLAISPDQESIAVGCEDGSLVMLDISGGPGAVEYKHALTRQRSRIMSLAFGPADIIYGGCSDSTIKAWNYRQAKGPIVGRMTVDKVGGEHSLVWSILVLKNGTIVSGDSTGAVKLWDPRFYSLSQNFKVHAADVLCLTSNAAGDTLFSAGVDQKMQTYKLVDQKRRWAHITGRRFHQHDVRAMASYESRTSSIVVTGGVDMGLALIPLAKFLEDKHRIISPVPPSSVRHISIATASEPRLLLKWADHEIKIWALCSAVTNDALKDDLGDASAQLVSRMRLANQENITYAEISPDAKYIIVCSLDGTKLFALQAGEGLRPKKLHCEAIESLASRRASFLSNGELCILTRESDLLLFDLTDGQATRKLDLEVDRSADESATRGQTYLRNVRDYAFAPDGRHVGVCDYRNIITFHQINKAGTSSKVLSHAPALPSAVTAMTWRGDDGKRLAVACADMAVHEFEARTGRLTPWARTNTPRLPRIFSRLKDHPCGAFFDSRAERCWLWGANWLANIAMDQDLPIEEAEQQVALKGKRRRLSTASAVADDDEDDEDALAAAASLSQDLVASDDAVAPLGRSPFWMTTRYKPILHVSQLTPDLEFVVVERPLSDILSDPQAAVPPPFYRKRYGRG